MKGQWDLSNDSGNNHFNFPDEISLYLEMKIDFKASINVVYHFRLNL